MSARVCIVGLGLTGMSMVRHYRARGWQVRIYDQRLHPTGLPALMEEFGNLTCTQLDSYEQLAELANDYDEVALSPGIPLHSIPAGLPITGDLSLFCLEWEKRWLGQKTRPCLIAVTGTNGKSTVCELIAAMVLAGGAVAAAVGNIGIPLLDAFASWEEEGWPDCVVIEASSYQLATLQEQLSADVAVLLNITPDHLTWHGSFDDYLAAKRKIFSSAACGVYDETDSVIGAKDVSAKRKVSYNSTGLSSDQEGWGIEDKKLVGPDGAEGPEAHELVRAGIMPGSAIAALTVAHLAMPQQDTALHLDCLKTIEGLTHRLQHVAVIDGVTFINDSKATNVAAACMALEVVGGPCVPILGGEDKKQDFSQLAQTLTQENAPAAVLLGKDTKLLQAALDKEGVEWHKAKDMGKAVNLAMKLARERQVQFVMLSPACASHDSYEDFASRGDDFVEKVAGMS